MLVALDRTAHDLSYQSAAAIHHDISSILLAIYL